MEIGLLLNMHMKRKFEEYMEDDETALAIHAAAQAAAEQAELFNRKFIKRIVVKQDQVGRVIGKRSEMLTKLKQISGVLVDQSSRLQGYSTVVIADDDRKKFEECVRAVEELLAPRKSEHTMEIPEKSARFIIGPQGRVIREINQEFSVQVVIGPGNENRKCLEIFGSPDNVHKAKQRITDILSGVFRPQFREIENSVSAQYFKLQQDVLNALIAASTSRHEHYMLEISDQDAVRLSRNRGHLLRQLRKQSLAKIFVDVSDRPERRVVVVVGPPFAAARALGLVRERLQDAVRMLEIPSPEKISEIKDTVEADLFKREWEEYAQSLALETQHENF